MRVSPLDIRKQEFTRVFRGYEPEEVNQFLEMLSREWEEMRDEHRRLEEQLRAMDDKIRHYERVEEALQEALQTARDSSRKTVQNAEERGRIIIQRAETQAGEITADAAARLERLKQENARLMNRQHEIVARLRAFLTSEMEMLKRFQGDELVSSESPEVRQASAPRNAPVRENPPGETVAPRRQPEETRSRQSEPEAAGRTPRRSEESRPDQPVQPEQEPSRRRAEEPTIRRAGTFNVRSLVHQVEQEFGEHDDEDETERDELPSTSRRIPASPEDMLSDDDDQDEESKTQKATEEIEKIRRILNDLD